MIGAARASRGENELLLLEFRELDTGAVRPIGEGRIGRSPEVLAR